MLQYFMYLLILVWTMLFGFIFFRLFPDATDQIVHKNKYEDIRDEGDRYVAPCPQQPMLEKQRPLAEKELNELPIHKQIPNLEQEEIPLDENDPPIELKIEKKEESPSVSELQQNIEKQLSSALENRLIQILVKINLAACKDCTKDDKKTVLQLKMMQAFLKGKPKEAMKYSEELDKYIKTNKIPINNKKLKPLKDPNN